MVKKITVRTRSGKPELLRPALSLVRVRQLVDARGVLRRALGRMETGAFR